MVFAWTRLFCNFSSEQIFGQEIFLVPLGKLKKEEDVRVVSFSPNTSSLNTHIIAKIII